MLWLYFIVLAVIIFVMLWCMQVFFLQTYYRTMKKAETVQIGNEIENIFTESLDFKREIDQIAYKNSASIYILSQEGELFYTNTLFSGGQNSSVNNTSGTTNATIANGNNAQMPGRNVSIDISDIATRISQSSSGKIAYTLEIAKFDTEVYVYGKVIADTDYCYVILMSIDPIDATSSVITSQLIYITIISLILSTVISMYMSKRISRPIMELNESAQKLGKGNYDVEFKKCGYKEIDELADTLNTTTKSLEKTDEIRRELLANVSHDLKTPLTMIKAYSEMIRDLSGDNKVKREEHLKVIIDETDRLTRLVNDMMDLSRMESGLISLEKDVFNFSEVASSLIDRIKISNATMEHEIKYSIPNGLYVNADITKIEQVLYNLITNAIKHSGEGTRHIQVKVTSTLKRIKVEVIDDGIGITEENLKHIWDRYYRASESFTRNVQGSGLGLAIVKNILVKHGSNYGVISEVGKGSNFWFDLERARKETPKESKDNTKEAKAKDNKENKNVKNVKENNETEKKD